MERSYSVQLKAQVSDYLAGIRQASKATRDFAAETKASATSHKADWQQVGQAVTVAGLAIAAGVGLAINRFAEFDQAMSAAAAGTNATAADLLLLRDAAIKAGADTQYSATEAAQAITELGKAGVSTADILSGGLAGALSLAAAGQMDVAKAAEVAAVALKQFKLGGGDLGHVADLLAAGAGKAVGSVEDLGMALKQSGQVAAQTGLSIDETTAALSAFAASGLIGSDAGTSFKSMLQRLTPQSKEAADEMTRLGISAYDSQGNFVGLERFAGNLQRSLSGLTVQQRQSAMATIFGADAIRAAAVLYDQGADGVRTWTTNVNDAGFAARQAARLTDNWRGDLERLGGSFDSVLIQGGSGANATLRSMTQSLESVVDWFGRLPAPVQSSAVTLGAVSAAALLVGGAVISAVPKITAFKASIDAMTASSARGAAALTTLGKAAGLVVVAGAGLSAAYSGMQGVVNGWSGANDDAVKSLDALLRAGARAEGVTGAMRTGFSDLGAAVERVFNENVWVKATNVLDSIMFWDGSQAGDSIEFFRQMDGALAGFVGGGRAKEAADQFARITAEAERQGIPLDRLAAAFPQYAAALDGMKASGEALNPVVQTSAQVVDDYFQAAQNAARATTEYADAVKKIASPILDARAAVRQWEEAIDAADAALKRNGKTLDVGTEKGRANQAALDGMAQAAIANVGAMAASGASQVELQKTLDASRARLEAQAIKFGMSKDAARQYAEQLLSVPPTVATTIIANTSAAMANVQRLKDLVSMLKDRTLNIVYQTQLKNAAAHGVATFQASGGYITGPGTATSDSIPAYLSNGEYVVKAAAVDKYGVRMLHQINAMRFADGGFVSRSAPAPTPTTNPVSDALSPAVLAAAVASALDGASVQLTGWERGSDALAGRIMSAYGRA